MIIFVYHICLTHMKPYMLVIYDLNVNVLSFHSVQVYEIIYD